MCEIGFSTGSLALSDYWRGLTMLRNKPSVDAIELSALRENELVPLIDDLNNFDLSQFAYISIHAPSKLEVFSEAFVIAKLRVVAERGWPIIVHPDVIRDANLWQGFGELLCIENMDKRKPTGRTAVELARIFDKLPSASLCFDIGHAKQVDPTMCEAGRILRYYGNRLKQLHVSEVTSQSKHESLSYGAVIAFRKIADLIPGNIPLILETPVSENQIETEIARASDALKRSREQRGTQLV
jgi:hypothetical protein